MAPTTGPESGSVPVVLGAPPARRADAARNRTRLLGAARQLIAERGVQAVTMDELAKSAGVGKGTVYRAFGDRAGLAQALVDDAERELQEHMLTGRPPLGPGAQPLARTAAFVAAYLRLLDSNAELLIEIDHDSPGRRFTTGAYAFWRAHLAGLAEAAGTPEPQLIAELLLGLVGADLYRHLRDEGFGLAHIRQATVTAALTLFTHHCH